MTLLDLRRALRVTAGPAAAVVASLVVAAGALDWEIGPPGADEVVLFTGVLLLVVVSIMTAARFEPPSARAQRISLWSRAASPMLEAQLSLALVVGVHALLAATSLPASHLYPLLYGVVAFSASFQARAGAWTAVLAAIALEIAASLRGPLTQAAMATATIHLCFIAGSASAHVLFLRGFVRRQRVRHERRLADEVEQLRTDARDYRLIALALDAESRALRSREEEEEKLAASAVEALRTSVYHTLGLLKRSLRARTCALLWLDDSESFLKIKELVSDSDAVTEKGVIRLRGALRAVVRDGAPLLLAPARSKQLPYYELDEPVGGFAGVPVREGPHVRGILCADRSDPFEDRDLDLLVGAGEQIVRSVQSEKVFTAVERSRYEQERFYRASAMLSRALTPEQVMETAISAAEEIIDFDLAVITLHDRARRRHRVSKVRVAPGADAVVAPERLTGLEFRDNAGLVSMVVKNKHYLPAAGTLRDSATPIFTKRIKVRGVESLLVLPLTTADEAIGTFTLASRRPRRFGKHVREMLCIIANQVAVSLENAKMYKEMETMATTDGLTGLTNHRSFQEGLADLLERAARHGHDAALLLTDVDHFKKVNDTYGHPVGDEVLRRVARVLAAAVRKIDIVARYGGEEFVVVLEATSVEGAIGLAERVREDVASQVMESDQGSFGITMSFGVAGFPSDADEREGLIERADLALYHAKQTGRNRVVSFADFDASRRTRKAG